MRGTGGGGDEGDEINRDLFRGFYAVTQTATDGEPVSVPPS